MFFRRKTKRELEQILIIMKANAENNYKDSAQANYKEFKKKFEELQSAGQLSDRQIAYYDEIKKKYLIEMQGFRH